MEKAIKCYKELKEYFFRIKRFSNRGEDFLNKGIFIDSKIRKECLISEDQGKMILEGRIREILFENKGSGVYRAYLEKIK